MTLTIEPYPKRKKRPVVKRKVKKRKKSRTNLTKALDAVFSQWVRLSFAEKDGTVKCYTCPKILPWKQIQNGHYVTRSVRITRWQENNCRPQCYGCNVMHGGQPITFRENLVKEMGEDGVLHLEWQRHTLMKYSDEWLTRSIEAYTKMVNELLALITLER